MQQHRPLEADGNKHPLLDLQGKTLMEVQFLEMVSCNSAFLLSLKKY